MKKKIICYYHLKKFREMFIELRKLQRAKALGIDEIILLAKYY